MPNDQPPEPAAGEAPQTSRQFPGTPESAAEFRAFLAEIGETVNGFSRTLKRMGDDRERATIQRQHARIASGEIRIPGQTRVIMTIFRNSRRRRARQAAASPPAAPNASGGNGPIAIWIANPAPEISRPTGAPSRHE
jgi:hypothetical protein